MKPLKKYLRAWKKRFSFLLLVALFLLIALSAFFAVHVLALLHDDSWFGHKKVVTMDPWIIKHWQHLKIVTADAQIPKTILLWTPFFGATHYIPELEKLGCPRPKCLVTSDRHLLNRSDALIFHLRDLNADDLPAYRVPRQIWVLVHHESPHHTPNTLNRLNGLFNWTATYRLDSEIGLTPMAQRSNNVAAGPVANYARGKRRMVAWLVSNCQTPSKRETFVKELQKTVSVDVYGKCGLLSCLPVQSKECYEKLGKIYRFYLSFENSICKDYVTEKFFNILSTNMVPVVMGGANYTSIAPPSSYIDALSFKSPADLGQYLLEVARDEKKYNSYFGWRNTHAVGLVPYACQICKRLHEPHRESNYENVSHWWFGDANCRAWKVS